MLGTTLLSLADIVLLLVLGPSRGVTSDAGESTADSARNTVSNAGAEVVQLALGLLLLALEVLLATGLLQGLDSESVANGLLGRAGSLVPAASGAVRVVGGDAGGSDSGAGDLDGGLGGIVLKLRLILLGLAVVLVACVASDGADGRLDCASDAVDSGLEGGSVVVGRHGGWLIEFWLCVVFDD